MAGPSDSAHKFRRNIQWRREHPTTGHPCEGILVHGPHKGQRCPRDGSVRIGDRWYCRGHIPK